VEALKEERFDLLIVGGGITGAGVALDAALNGWRVALVDKGDFASATSSASSKLIHGGIRYLEHGDYRLVYEALHERRLLLHNAPHLVHPLRFIIPYYQPSRMPAWKWRLGLTLYDFLAGRNNIQRSRPIRLRPLTREFPGLQRGGLNGAAEYYDAQMNDARLCLEVIRTAALHGACVANYVETIGFEKRQGEITGVRVVDRLHGDEFLIHARQVLNATGPFVDSICRLAGDTSGPHLKPTKGVHLVAGPRGLTAAFLLLHPADGRVFFVIPWMGLGPDHSLYPAKTLIGTTDTLFHEGADSMEVTPEEVKYLLEGFNRYFTPPLKAEDIVNTFAGLRPLIRARSDDPSSLSREFKVLASPSGLLSIAGGKYTTYRRMAEVGTAIIAKRINRAYRKTTHHVPLDGAPAQPWPDFTAQTAAEIENRFGLPAELANHLVQRYGRRVTDVVAYLPQNPKLAEPVIAGEPDLLVEFLYQRDHEMALHPADFLFRRTRLGLFHPKLLQNPPSLIRELTNAG
jgi:glycerol-3-phosphate dehydrogenase